MKCRPIFGMSHVLAELAPDNTIKSTYLYAGPQLLKEEPSTTDRSLDLYMLHEGKVGSITHTVDMNGSVRNEYDYDTYGTRTNVKTASTGSNQHFGYTSEMQDAESGLLYLRARYYDPTIGRFISADPYLGRMAEPVTQNRYIYVKNNPLIYTDPSGMDSYKFELAYLLGGGGGISAITYDSDSTSVYFTQGLGGGLDLGITGVISPNSTKEGQAWVFNFSPLVTTADAKFDAERFHSTGDVVWESDFGVSGGERPSSVRAGSSATYQITMELFNVKNDRKRSINPI